MIVGVSLVIQQSFQAMPRQTALATGAVCAAGNVKYNVGTGYEYTDSSATITIIGYQKSSSDSDHDSDENENTNSSSKHNRVTWAPATGYAIDTVCVKIGGPGGGTLLYPAIKDGQAGPYAYDISHVVIKTHRITPPVTTAGSITMKKIVDSGTASPDDFRFTISPDPNGIGVVQPKNGIYIFSKLPVGKYSITELPLAGYEQVSSTCLNVEITSSDDEDDSSSNGLSSTHSTSSDDESINASCVIHNRAKIVPPPDEEHLGSLTVEKIVDSGTASPDVFSFSISPDPKKVGVVHPLKGRVTFDQLPAGTYTVTELPMDGYHQVSSTCTDVLVSVDDEDDDHDDASAPDSSVAASTYSNTNSSDDDGHDDDEDEAVSCVIHNAKNIVHDPQFDIAFKKSGPASIQPGQLMTYTLTWSVLGDHAVTNAKIQDALPANTTYESASCGTTGTAFCGMSHTTSTATWELGTRQPGDSGTVEITVRAITPLAHQSILTNVACFSTSETSEKCDTAKTTISSQSVITLDKQAPASITAGGQLTYALVWTVTGNAPVTSAVINDPIPTNTTFVAADAAATFGGNTVSWNLGTKVPGDTGTVHVTVKVASPVTNGTVITNTGCFDTSETSPVCDEAKTTIQSAPQLTITKSNGVAAFTTPGQTVAYTVSVTNATTATDAARDVLLTDVLPTGFTHTIGGGATKSFTLGTIAPGVTMTTTYTATIASNQAAGIYTNTASAQGSNTTKVTATSNVEVRIPQVLGTSTPDLTITKSVKTATTNPGKIVTYTLKITNVSDVVANNLVITDKLPNGLTFVSNGKRTMMWNVRELGAGKSISLPYTVKVSENIRAGKYTNVASVTADDVSKKEAKRSIEVKVPQVLGLATTGAGPRDYAMIGFGISLIGFGVIWYTQLRRRYGHSHA